MSATRMSTPRSAVVWAGLAASLTALAAVALLAAPVADSAQAAPVATSAQGAPGKPRILAPKPGALITGRTVKVRIRSGGPRPRLIVRNRDLSRKLHRSRGGTMVAVLRRGKQLRRGTNRIVVSSGRGAERRYIARTFVVGARKPGALRVKRRKHSRAAVRLRISRSPKVDFAHVSVRLNGRRVRTRDWVPGTTTPSTRWPLGRRHFDAMLGADDGLRFGRNRLVITAWSDDGFYGRVARTVKVSRRAPLVAARGGRRARVGRKLVFDGSGTRPAPGKRVAYSWRIVRRPQGSKARLHAIHSAHPWLRPDRNGRYRVRLFAHHVSVGGRHPAARAASAAPPAAAPSAAGPAAIDELTVEATPALPPLGAPIQTITANGSIEVLGRQYPAKPGAWIQILTLDRNTLEVKSNESIGMPVENLHEAFAGKGPEDLLIVSGGNRQVTLSDHTSQATPVELVGGYLEEMGVISHPAASAWTQTLERTLEAGRWSAIGVPFGAESGTANLYGMIYGAAAAGGSQPGALTGYLQQDNHGHFKFVSAERSTINTNLPGSPAGTNRIQVGDSVYTAQLAPGESGFQVVVLDSLLEPTTQRTFVTNTSSGYSEAGVRDLQEFLTQISALNVATPGYLVVMQSIGEPRGIGPEWVDDEPLLTNSYGHDWYAPVPREPATWYAPRNIGVSLAGAVGQLAGPVAHDKIAQMAGTPPGTRPPAPGGFSLVASVGQSYYAVPPDRGSVPQARSQPPGEARIVGELTRDRQSLWGVETPAYDPNYEIPELRKYLFQPPTRWPLSETREQDAANEYITRRVLPRTHVSDMRVAYYLQPREHWARIGTKIATVEYPGVGRGFSKATFLAVRRQLAREAGYVATVWSLIEEWGDVFGSGSVSDIDLQAIATGVSTEIGALSDSADAEGEIGKIVGDALWLAAAIPNSGLSDALGAIAAALAVAGDLASDAEGGSLLAPVRATAASLGEELARTVGELAAGVNRAGAILVSDWGKLQAAARAASGPWRFHYRESRDDLDALINASEIELNAALLSTVYQIYVVNPPWVARTESRPQPWNIDCSTPARKYTGHFFGDEDSEPESWVALPAGASALQPPGNELFWYGISTKGNVGDEGFAWETPRILPRALSEKLFRGLGADQLAFFADHRFERHWFWCRESERVG